MVAAALASVVLIGCEDAAKPSATRNVCEEMAGLWKHDTSERERVLIYENRAVWYVVGYERDFTWPFDIEDCTTTPLYGVSDDGLGISIEPTSDLSYATARARIAVGDSYPKNYTRTTR